MLKTMRRALYGFFLVLLTMCALHQSVRAADPKLVVAYFANWGDAPEHKVANIPVDLVTHLNYAFGKIEAGQLSLTDHPQFAELKQLKQKYPHLKTLISMGGWGGSGQFSDIALSDESRAKFAKSCATFVNKYAFDGIDIDWEYPGGGGAEPGKGRAEDAENFVTLIRTVRAALDAQGKADGAKYLLTIAAPAGPQNFPKIRASDVHASLDWINVMTYDYTGTWSPITSLNSPVFPPSTDERANLSASTTMRMYLDAGVPPEKLVLGVPFYGHAFSGVPDVEHGLFQTHDKKTIRPPVDGEWTYRTIVATSLNKMQRYWNDTAKVPWLFDAKAGVMISYDDPESIRVKAQYARDQNFAGVMIWEISQDDDQHALLKALNDGLKRK